MKLSVALLILTSSTDVAQAFVPARLSHTSATKHIMPGNPLNVATVPSTEDVAIDKKSNNDVMENFGAMPDLTGIAFSGMKGKALSLRPDDFPLSRDIRAVLPEDSFEPDTATSLSYLAVSVIGTALCTFVGVNALSIFNPSNILSFPFWAAYSAVTGTVAMGLWVLAHECGHGAFSKDKRLQDIVGFCIHSLLLVPYYSWQRSHAVHHKYTNHMELGETHVPEAMEGNTSTSIKARNWLIEKLGTKNGLNAWGGIQAFLHLIVGWPAYLLIGATGGPARGMTNHFYPDPLTTPSMPKKELFKGNWKEKVLRSDIGIAAVVGGLVAWTACNGFAQMMALYGGPLLVINAWLVLYTWLQHTDVDVPHFSMDDHNYVKGALHTIDRPYDKLDPWGLIDFLHHKIGSTHVAHHYDSSIPHYKAQAATDAIKENFPELYFYDPTPIPEALWRVCKGCAAVEKRGEKWIWNNEGLEEYL
jgi:omega-6 fatty acid desaturase (delta-12 desaturase)